MKQFLDDENITALVAYRLDRAKETLKEADAMIEIDSFNAAINRLYYAVNALLVKNRISANTHQGVKQMFGLYFVNTHKIDAKFARFYSQLFNDRMSGDYDDFLIYDKNMLEIIRPEAEKFILEIESLL